MAFRDEAALKLKQLTGEGTTAEQVDEELQALAEVLNQKG